jgi:hypothetical protein
MFPIRDHNPSGRTPYVTLALIAVNVAVFLAYFPAASEGANWRGSTPTGGLSPPASWPGRAMKR